MAAPILPTGAFVWCRFPLHEANRKPGPPDKLHLVYVVDTANKNAVCVYTTSVTWPADTPIPSGVIDVSSNDAAAMGQKRFVLDTRRIGVFPLTTTWFPDLDKPDHGILRIAPESFQRRVAKAAQAIVKRKELIEFYGPGAPVITNPRKPPSP